MSFLNLEDKVFLVTGVANKKSVAFHTAKVLIENGAVPVFSVRSAERQESVAKLFPEHDIFVCDVEDPQQIGNLHKDVTAKYPQLDGMLHSIAFANYSEGFKPFHETKCQDFLQAVHISCYSLIELSNRFKDNFTSTASVLTVSISTTRMAAENYGYMAPVKAALDSAVCFLAKSFSEFSQIRFNSVNAGLLKTSASAGIPDYINSYLFAEQATLRKKGLQTKEVANTIAFLLSETSSGINAQGIILDAGMAVNYFDKTLVNKATRTD